MVHRGAVEGSPAVRQNRLPPIREVELWLSRLVQGRMAGMHPSSRIGPGYDLQRLRPFEPGDAPKDIDWVEYFRTGEYVVREAIREQELAAVVVFDLAPGVDFGRPRSARDLYPGLAAVFWYSAISSGDPAGALLVGTTTRWVPPSREEGDFEFAVSECLRIPATSTWSLAPALRLLQGQLDRPTLIGILSNFPAIEEAALDEFSRAIRGLRADQHDVVSVACLTPLERQFGPARTSVPLRSRSGHRGIAYPFSSRFRQDYAAACAGRLERLRRAAGTRTDFLVLFIDEPRPIHVLLDYLDQRTIQLQAR